MPVTARNPAACQSIAKEIEDMARAGDILRKMENEEMLPIRIAQGAGRSKQLAESLNSYWPAEYIVRESEFGVELHLEQERPADRPQGVHKPEFPM